jgi:hypothetical protein
MPKIKFTYSEVGCDRKHYVNQLDVEIVLSRLPVEAWNRLRAVHFNDKSWGTRLLGYANCAEREISICALPPGVSLTRFLVRGQSPGMFGAVRGEKWLEVSVRRFLLYDVLLHELGHLQLIDPTSKNVRRKYANEKRAQAFADTWRKELWQIYFDHPDPVHNPPADIEGEHLERGQQDEQGAATLSA